MLKFFASAAAALLLTCAPALSQVLVSSPGSGTLRTGDGFTLGMSFTVGGSDVSVTSLGVWVNGTSLANPKPVAIWDSTGSEIATVTVPAGAATLTDQFEYASITPVTLTAGHSYTAGVFYSALDTDKLHDHSATPTFSSDFNTYVARFSATNNAPGLTDPSGGAGSGGYVGPSFQYSVLPEPSALALGLALSLTGLRRSRRR